MFARWSQGLRRVRHADRLAVVIATAVAVSLLAVGLGLLLSPANFLSNLLAEIAGVGIGLVVAVMVVDVLLERRKFQQWLPLRYATYIELRDRISRILSGTRVLLIGEGPSQLWTDRTIWAYVASREALDGLTHYSKSHPEGATSESLFRFIERDVTLLRDVLTPRVLELGDDPFLGMWLVTFADSATSWEEAMSRARDNNMYLPESPRSTPAYYAAWNEAIRVLRAATTIARYLDETYPDVIASAWDSARSTYWEGWSEEGPEPWPDVRPVGWDGDDES